METEYRIPRGRGIPDTAHLANDRERITESHLPIRRRLRRVMPIIQLAAASEAADECRYPEKAQLQRCRAGWDSPGLEAIVW